MRGTGGFSLVELVVAALLSSLIMAGLWAIGASVYRFQREGYQQNIVQTSAVMSFQALARDMESASFLAVPESPGSGGDRLAGCTNYDPDPSLKPEEQELGRIRAFHYCAAACDEDANVWCLYYTWKEPAGSGDCNALGAWSCKDSLGASEDRIALARFVPAEKGSPPYFQRPAAVANVVEVHIEVKPPQVAGTIQARSFLLDCAFATAMPARPR